MNMNEMIEDYRRIINRKYSKEECLEIMIPFGIHEKIMSSVISLICDQPERSKREDSIEKIVPPNPHPDQIRRYQEDMEYINMVGGINHDLLGCGALNTMET